jgi:hypothetical protein
MNLAKQWGLAYFCMMKPGQAFKILFIQYRVSDDKRLSVKLYFGAFCSQPYGVAGSFVVVSNAQNLCFI